MWLFTLYFPKAFFATPSVYLFSTLHINVSSGHISSQGSFMFINNGSNITSKIFLFLAQMFMGNPCQLCLCDRHQWILLSRDAIYTSKYHPYSYKMETFKLTQWVPLSYLKTSILLFFDISLSKSILIVNKNS